MKVLILTPTAFPALTGNAITTERWRRSLTDRGLTVDVLAADGLDSLTLRRHLQSLRPDLVHVYHAFKAGSLLLEPPFSEGWDPPPLVVSPGGTDINQDLEDTQKRFTVVRVLGMAALILVQGEDMARQIARQMPEWGRKLVLIPKATQWFGNESCNLREITKCAPTDILFFLPAGIRPIKQNLECLLALEQVHLKKGNIRFVAVGPAMDADYATRFQREISRLAGFAHWMPAVPPAAMKSAYHSSDIVVNASLSEGLSNSLLEAIAAGRPYLASDIAGNRQISLTMPGTQPAGLLFDPRYLLDLEHKAVRLMDDPSLRENLRIAACTLQSKLPHPSDEARAIIAAYQSILSKAHPALHGVVEEKPTQPH